MTEEVESKVQVNEKKSSVSKTKTQPSRPPSMGFKRDSHKVVIEAECFLEQEKPGLIFHDFEPIQRMANNFASATFGDHEAMTSNPMLDNEWRTCIGQMIDIVMAKKLAASLSAKHVLENVKVVQHLVRQEVWFPSALMPVINMFGKVRSVNSEYDLVGQPFLALTYAMRGMHPDVNNNAGANNVVDRRNDIFINTASPATYDHAKQWLRGYVNAWSSNAPAFTLDFGQPGGVPVLVTMSIPKLVSGASGYIAMLNGITIPPLVLVALHRLEFLESIPNIPAWNLNQVNGAFQLGIQVINFNRDSFEAVTGTYGRDTQAKLLNALQVHYAMAPVKTVGDTGNSGQLIRRDRTIGHAPDKVLEEDIDIGWMMSGGLCYASMETERFLVTSKSSGDAMMVKYFQNMRKS
jgi:hypothetical protein